MSKAKCIMVQGTMSGAGKSLHGISFDVSSSPYLDVSVQAVPLMHLWIQCMILEYELQ